MTWPGNAASPERLFIVELAAEADAVARVLALFAVHACRLTGLELETGRAPGRLIVRAGGLDPERAEHLCRRIAGMPVVLGVSLGWRDRPSPDG